jgi:hypothetical protein
MAKRTNEARTGLMRLGRCDYVAAFGERCHPHQNKHDELARAHCSFDMICCTDERLLGTGKKEK